MRGSRDALHGEGFDRSGQARAEGEPQRPVSPPDQTLLHARAKRGRGRRGADGLVENRELPKEYLKVNGTVGDRKSAAVTSKKVVDGTSLGMKRKDRIIAEMQAACAAILDRRGVAPKSRQRVIASLATLVRDEFTSGKREPAEGGLGAPPSSPQISFAEPQFPKGAPQSQRWSTHRKPGEGPAEFILRVYGPNGAGWLDKGLTMRQLRQRDESLVTQFYRWRKRHTVPKGLEGRLPTVKEFHDRLLSAYAQIHSRHGGVKSTRRELRRLSSLAERRPVPSH
jgi:hypothetical protein